jgi:hypothetical protein
MAQKEENKQLSMYKSDLISYSKEVHDGTLDVEKASAIAKLANAVIRVDNGILQRVRIEERAKRSK